MSEALTSFELCSGGHGRPLNLIPGYISIRRQMVPLFDLNEVITPNIYTGCLNIRICKTRRIRVIGIRFFCAVSFARFELMSLRVKSIVS